MENKLNWFHEARFGMFIHWGAYSVAARGEWFLNRELIPYEEYIEKYVNNFKAERYNPREWARLARKAGMKYIVFTTRHHDGFALWDTKTSDFNSVKMGPGKDLVRIYADAVREEGLKLGFYYSVADWHHPDYPDAYARDWPQQWKDEESRKKFVNYYCSQLQELMTNYGKIDLLWYDGCIPAPTDGEEINRRIKILQPDILINDRNGEPYDFECCEQVITPSKAGMAWEACMTLNRNWGYHAGDKHYKSARDVINLLIDVSDAEGNLLLNIGPKADGTIPEETEVILNDVGEWLHKNGEFLPNSQRSPFSWNNCSRITVKENKIYIHIFNSPGEEMCVPEIKNRVLSARFLATGEAIPFEQCGERLFLRNLPVSLRDKIAETIVLEVKGTPKATRKRPDYQWIGI